MLSVEPAKLADEVRAGVKLREQRLSAVRDLMRGYAGPAYASYVGTTMTSAREDYNPENHSYEYIRLILPQLVMDNPRLAVHSRRVGPQAEVALAIKHGMNRWARDTELRSTLNKAAYDYLFTWGVLMTVREPNHTLGNQHGDLSMWPKTNRISPLRYFMDPMATSQSNARFQGHKYIVDKEDLLRMAEQDDGAGWNLDVIRGLKPGVISEDEVRRASGGREAPDRGEVELHEVWIPEYEGEDHPGENAGFHGSIFTLVLDHGNGDPQIRADFPRDPRPYYGPRWGPYALIGAYTVPDQQYPLSPLVATEGQARDLNNMALAVTKASQKYKQLIMVDSTDPRITQKIKSGDDLQVIPVEGLERSKFIQAEAGGATDTMLNYLGIARDRMDRNSGISEAMRGNMSGATATESSIAERSLLNSLEYIKLQWRSGVEQALRTAAWYLYYDDEVVFPLGSDAAKEIGAEEAWFLGGETEHGSGYTFDDLELAIEAHSMERPDERTTLRRTIEYVNTIASIAPLTLQAPHIDWSRIHNMLGEAYGIPGAEDVFDENLYAEVVGAMAQEQGEQSPALARTLGGREPPRARPSRATTDVEGFQNGNAQTAMQNLTNQTYSP
jgi:hypothetical protein